MRPTPRQGSFSKIEFSKWLFSKCKLRWFCSDSYIAISYTKFNVQTLAN